MKRTICSAVTIACATWAWAQLNITHLKVEQMTNPTTVDARHPRFSWTNEPKNSNEKGKRQTAYRIGVASTRQKAKARQFDVWDSQRQQSDASVLVPYSGRALRSGADYYWCVQTWDEHGVASAWSETASWGMGLLDRNDWKGQWIAPSRTTDTAPMLRKAFATAGNRIEQAKVFICGLGYFQLYVNDQRVGNDELVPGFTNFSHRPQLPHQSIALEDNFTGYRVLYLAYDVTDHLRKGKNAIGVLLGNGWARPPQDKPMAGYYCDPCLKCQLEITYADGSKQIVATDNTWRTLPSPIHYNSVYHGELYDARSETEGWAGPHLDDSQWEQVACVSGPTGELSAMTAPTDKIVEVRKPKSITRLEGSTARWEVDFGTEIAGWIRFKDIVGQQGDTLQVDYICESPQGTQRYVFSGKGKESYAPHFTWFTFSKAVISGIERLEEANLQAEAVNTDVAPDATFHSSNPLLDNILTIWKRSQLDNMHGCIASDCPHRERHPYTGDGQIACAMVMDHFDAAAFYNKWIRDVRDAQDKTTGYVPNGAPWQPGCGGGVPWGAAMNVMPWEYYVHYGDRQMLEQCYEPMKAQVGYMRTWLTHEGIMFQKRSNVGSQEPLYWLNLGDWCPPYQNPRDELVHTFYLWYCTHITAATASVLGKNQEARAYADMAEQTAAAFHRVFWNEQEHTYGDFGSNVFALCMGVPAERQQDVVNALRQEIEVTHKGHLHTGIMGTRFLFETLARFGMNQLAYEILNKTDFPSFGHWIAQGATTTWEQWDGGNSHNHPMFGGGLTWYASTLAGIHTDHNRPAYRHVTICPQLPDGLSHVDYSKHTPYGLLRSHITREDGLTRATFTIPVGTTATLVLPSGIRTIDQGTWTFTYR